MKFKWIPVTLSKNEKIQSVLHWKPSALLREIRGLKTGIWLVHGLEEFTVMMSILKLLFNTITIETNTNVQHPENCDISIHWNTSK